MLTNLDAGQGHFESGLEVENHASVHFGPRQREKEPQDLMALVTVSSVVFHRHPALGCHPTGAERWHAQRIPMQRQDAAKPRAGRAVEANARDATLQDRFSERRELSIGHSRL